MSEEQLKGFLEAVAADEWLQEQLKAAADTDAVVEIAKATGFVISAEEFKNAQAEMSEEELQGVAGGGVRAAVVGAVVQVGAVGIGMVLADFAVPGLIALK